MDPIYQKSGWSILHQTVCGASRSGSYASAPGRGATFALLLLSSGFCAANVSQPKNIRVSLQFLEVAHPVLTEMLGGDKTGGAAMHAKAIALAKDGQAKILETCVLMCLSGQKATVESIREFIYPCEYHPPDLTWHVPPTDKQRAAMPPEPPSNPVFRYIGAFETRNTGVTFEIAPTWDEAASNIELRLVPQVVTQVRLDTWMEHVDEWGDASLRMPAFETWRVNTSVSLMPGQFEMVSVITPIPNAPGPSGPRKILVFVRADVITL